jgi:hypothetical protein
MTSRQQPRIGDYARPENMHVTLALKNVGHSSREAILSEKLGHSPAEVTLTLLCYPFLELELFVVTTLRAITIVRSRAYSY